MPWLDHAGAWSPLKTAVFAALFLPGAWILSELLGGAYGTRPATGVIHETGLWTIRLLFLSLAITPLRQALQWPRLVLVRRMVGVAAFAYLVTHLAFFIVDQRYDLAKVASEIALRIYLTIGFGAVLILAALAVTSTDAMVRRLGGKAWRRLHRYAYLAAILGTIHFFMQSKFTVVEPTWMAGVLAWMFAWRLAAVAGATARAPVLVAFALAPLAGMATAAGEAAYLWFKLGAPPLTVMGVNLDLDAGLRPAQIAFAIALLVALAAALRRLVAPPSRARLKPA